jgi:RimJ/RimL family protein N-acetyltransferase
VFKYAFQELGLNRINAKILSINTASRRSGEKFGYTYEGTLRKAIFRNGEFHDVLLFSMLREEFVEKLHMNQS